MSREKRAALLRDRARAVGPFTHAKPRGLYRAQYPSSGGARPRRASWTNPKGWGFVAYGPMLAHKPREWVTTPESPPVDPNVPTTKRRTGVPALVKIAAQLLKKRKRGVRTLIWE